MVYSSNQITCQVSREAYLTPIAILFFEDNEGVNKQSEKCIVSLDNLQHFEVSVSAICQNGEVVVCWEVSGLDVELI